MQRAVRNTVLGAQIGLIAVVALFVALGVNGFLAAAIVRAIPSGPSVQGEPLVAPEEVPKKAEENVLLYNRNLFNQAAEEVEGPSAESRETQAETSDYEPIDEPAPAPGAPVETDLRVLLVGTQVASDAKWSLAILKELEAGAGADAIYKRVGETFMEDATIIHIARNRVYFERHSASNRIEFVDIETVAADIMSRARAVEAEKPAVNESASKAKSQRADPKTASASPPRAGRATADAVDPNAIKALGADTFGVPRDMAEAVRDNPKILQDPKFGQPPQIQPVYKGGTVSGFRVLNVQPNSVYHSLGIRNGDIIADVNGKIVDNPQKALSFFDQLSPGSNVTVTVKRKGRNKGLTYKLQ